MKLVIDSTPIIFLSKIRRLSLLRDTFHGDILIPDSVEREVLSNQTPPHEEIEIRHFLERCRRVTVSENRRFARGLSATDNGVIAVAHAESANAIVSDDRLLRRVSEMEGFAVLGTIGILLRAISQGYLTGVEADESLRELVRDHGFRISTAVYDAARRTILDADR